MLAYSETPNLHTHTLKVAVIQTGPETGTAANSDTEFTLDLVRQTLLSRLHLLNPLHDKLVDIAWRLHHSTWLENCEVDFDSADKPAAVRTSLNARTIASVGA